MKPTRMLLIPILVLAGLAFPAATAHSWPSTCDNCYEGTNRFNEPDAQCCLDGNCGTWESDPDYSRTMSNMEFCTSYANEGDAGCNGTANSCSAGGGDDGDGEDECTITVGEWCPPSCSHCYVVI